MHPLALIIVVSWICFWVYWIVSAASAKASTRPGNLKRFAGARLGTIGLAAVLALLAHHLSLSLGAHPLGTTLAVKILGLVLFAAGMTLAVWARIYLGRNWGMPMTEKQDPELVTSGPYQYVRHPIYTGFLSMALGSAIDVNSYWLLVLVVAAVYFIYSAVAEERLLTRQFPKAYPPYKRRTKMLIPFVF